MIKEVEVIAVCDLNQDRLKATAKKYSTKPVYRLSKDVGEGGTGRRISFSYLLKWLKHAYREDFAR